MGKVALFSYFHSTYLKLIFYGYCQLYFGRHSFTGLFITAHDAMHGAVFKILKLTIW